MSPAGCLSEPLADLIARVPAPWFEVVQAWAETPAGRGLAGFLDQRRAEGVLIYPAAVFRALELTPLSAVRVVVLGQDPYHGPGQAEGLAFSVPPGVRPPPSLRNILAELARDTGLAPATTGHLGAWARRGVLLLNTSLTVEAGQPASHARRGWEALTDRLIATVARDAPPKVFMLWGAHAQSKAALVAAGGPHCVLASNHPSPLSARRGPVPFIGSGPFSAADRFVVRAGQPSIDWRLEPVGPVGST